MKKSRGRAKTKPMVSALEIAERLVSEGSSDAWVVLPSPIRGLERDEFVKAVTDSRIDLVHKNWPEANEAVRELSDWGGVESATVHRVTRSVRAYATFVEGKKVSR